MFAFLVCIPYLLASILFVIERNFLPITKVINFGLIIIGIIKSRELIPTVTRDGWTLPAIAPSNLRPIML